ncbi:MAG: response regulator [Deltaproteobacteria bacterium]|nr:response regulator [Deltaproteobacteria bacterium]
MTNTLRALIVDDKEENLYFLQSLLQGHGFAVTAARHGAEAMMMARQVVPSIIVSDLLMPVMDGYTLLRQWKADAQLKAIPFVVYTATYTEPADEKLAYGLGADAFLVKPLEPAELMARIFAAMASAPRMGEPDGLHAAEEAPDLFKLYSASLVRKLEEKTQQLTESNQALVEEKAQLQMRERAIRAVPQGIVITDATLFDNPIVFVSPGFERLTGYPPHEALGKNCRFLQGPKTDKEVVAKLRHSLALGQACAVELLNYRKDGTTFWNNLSVSPVVDEVGKVVNFVGVQADVTQQRELEAQLRQAQKMDAVGQLAAGVAHDFNNLLSVILGYSSFLMEDLAKGSPVWMDIEQIHRAGKRAKELTQHLLAFSRRKVSESRVLDPAEQLASMQKMLYRLLGEDIELSLLLSKDCGHVRADPTEMEQVVMNLAVNARDAMPRGGRLIVEAANVELDAGYAEGQHDVTPGPYVMIAVTDTGEGMDAQTQERIFEPFFTTKDGERGTGLGLSTVFGIVKQNGGHILVYSEPSQGTTFKIYLPRVDEAVQAATLEQPLVNLQGTETVLVVEDDEQVRGVTSTTLRRNGYRVIEAENGATALKLCTDSDELIHLLLTDVVMPGMGGKPLFDGLCALRPKMRVLFVSGYTENTVLSRGVLDRGMAFLQKPIIPDLLLRKVRQVLDAGQ